MENVDNAARNIEIGNSAGERRYKKPKSSKKSKYYCPVCKESVLVTYQGKADHRMDCKMRKVNEARGRAEARRARNANGNANAGAINAVGANIPDNEDNAENDEVFGAVNVENGEAV